MSANWYIHPAPIVFKVSGRDSRRYLNNRLSNDLRSVGPGSALVAGALTPQGKVEGLFVVYVITDELFYLVCDGGARQPLFASVGRYIVADRVSIVDVSSESVAGHLSVEGVPGIDVQEGAVFRSMPRRRIATTGRDFLITGIDPAAVIGLLRAKLGEPLGRDSYDTARFLTGFVQYPEEVNDTLILTEAGLRDTVSFTKGCYVGQEVIERSDAIGKVPRTMERVVFDAGEEIARDARVVSIAGQQLGKVVSIFSELSDGRRPAYCLLKTGTYAIGDRALCNGVNGEILTRECEAP